jgi:hypothetical protein
VSIRGYAIDFHQLTTINHQLPIAVVTNYNFIRTHGRMAECLMYLNIVAFLLCGIPLSASSVRPPCPCRFLSRYYAVGRDATAPQILAQEDQADAPDPIVWFRQERPKLRNEPNFIQNMLFFKH